MVRPRKSRVQTPAMVDAGLDGFVHYALEVSPFLGLDVRGSPDSGAPLIAQAIRMVCSRLPPSDLGHKWNEGEGRYVRSIVRGPGPVAVAEARLMLLALANALSGDDPTFKLVVKKAGPGPRPTLSARIERAFENDEILRMVAELEKTHATKAAVSIAAEKFHVSVSTINGLLRKARSQNLP